MIRIVPKRGEKIISALRRLRKACEREGILKDVYKHSYYEKPSDKKRRLRRKAERRAKQSILSKQRNDKNKKTKNTKTKNYISNNTPTK